MIRTDVLVSSPIFLVGLVHVLTSAGINVNSESTSLEEEPSWLADVAVIDEDALGTSGDLSCVFRAAELTAVLVLTNERTTEVDIYFRAGASGVISKRESAECIVAAVRAIAAGDRHWDDSGDAVDCEGDPLAPERPEVPGRSLSEREDQVLRQISRGLTHGQIATRLGISPHTVDTYVKRIRAKLGVGNKAELTRAALMGHLVGGGPSANDRRPERMSPAVGLHVH